MQDVGAFRQIVLGKIQRFSAPRIPVFPCDPVLVRAHGMDVRAVMIRQIVILIRPSLRVVKPALESDSRVVGFVNDRRAFSAHRQSVFQLAVLDFDYTLSCVAFQQFPVIFLAGLARLLQPKARKLLPALLTLEARLLQEIALPLVPFGDLRGGLGIVSTFCA